MTKTEYKRKGSAKDHGQTVAINHKKIRREYTMPKKPTLATLKSFVRRNKGNLQVRFRSDFDGMTDCVQRHHNPQWQEARDSDQGERMAQHDLGVSGAYCVLRGRDYITPLSEPGYDGYAVYNCCGSWDIAVNVN